MSDMLSWANSIGAVMILVDETWTNDKNKYCSPPTESKCNVHRVSNRTVEFSILQKTLGLEFMRFWIVPFVVQHCPMEQSLRNEESTRLNIGRWLSPLVGDHKRIGGDIIVVVDIIAA